MEVLQKPIITEKMSKKGDALNQYGFIVEKTADKDKIKKAVEEMYGVTVVAVNTMRCDGKLKVRNTKKGLMVGRTNAFKKAIVTIQKDQKIDFYSNI